MAKPPGNSGSSRGDQRKGAVDKSRKRIWSYMTEYLPGLVKTVAIKAARIRDVITDDGEKDQIGTEILDPNDMYRVRYQVSTIEGVSYYIFFECNLFRARIRYGLATDPPVNKEVYEEWLRSFTGAFESNGWNVVFLPFDEGHFVEVRATIGMQEGYIWKPPIYMRLAEQVAASMGMIIVAAQRQGFQTLASIPDRVEPEF